LGLTPFLGLVFTGMIYDSTKANIAAGIQTVAHPIDTGKAVIHAAENPGAAASAVKQAVTADWNGGLRGQGKVVSDAANALANVAEGGEGLTVSAAKVTQKTEEIANIARGGRLGNQTTRDQVADIAGKLKQHGWDITHGGGEGPEEYIPGLNGRKGSSYPDITATKNGKTLRVNTIDTRADGVTPTTREANSATRIRSQKPDDKLILVPKSN
jgi:hypothetical protein